MKKVFNLLVSFVLIAGFSACSKRTIQAIINRNRNIRVLPLFRQRTIKVLHSFLPENPLSGLHKWGPRMKSHWNTALMNPIGSHTP